MPYSMIKNNDGVFVDFSLGEKNFLESLLLKYSNFPNNIDNKLELIKLFYYAGKEENDIKILKDNHKDTFEELISIIENKEIRKFLNENYLEFKKIQKEEEIYKELYNFLNDKEKSDKHGYSLFDIKKERDIFNAKNLDLIGIFESNFKSNNKNKLFQEFYFGKNDNKKYGYSEKLGYYEEKTENGINQINTKKYLEKFFGIFYEDLDKVFKICSRKLFFNYELDFSKNFFLKENLNIIEFLSLSKGFMEDKFDNNKEFEYFFLKNDKNYIFYKNKYKSIKQKLEELREKFHNDIIFYENHLIFDELIEENERKLKKIKKEILINILKDIFFINDETLYQKILDTIKKNHNIKKTEYENMLRELLEEFNKKQLNNDENKKDEKEKIKNNIDNFLNSFLSYKKIIPNIETFIKNYKDGKDYKEINKRLNSYKFNYFISEGRKINEEDIKEIKLSLVNFKIKENQPFKKEDLNSLIETIDSIIKLQKDLNNLIEKYKDAGNFDDNFWKEIEKLAEKEKELKSKFNKKEMQKIKDTFSKESNIITDFETIIKERSFKNYLKSNLDTTNVVHYLNDEKLKEIF